MDVELKPQSALKLTLEGSVGSFKVSGRNSAFDSLEVKFFLTHVSLDFERGSTSDVLDYLAPVREIYEPETLEFDEIMQRDLDDARVSSELIPYLLDPSNRDLVKIFPPIIVVVLPTEPGSERPADKYPKVHRPQPIPSENQKYAIEILRSGDIGNEVFQFENPIQNGRSVEHDLARLKLNPQRTKLVIVDGQHRAMALLALYRNLRKEWTTNPRRLPYKDYYAEWTEDYIKQFKLDKLSMPVMFCTFPDLDVDFQREYDLKKASRAIFLALNKNAKKVSDSRNRLLDDNDIVALFLRAVLSRIKAEHQSALRIYNVELDQTHDKMKIDSPIAITGVNHVYYMIEHCLLNQQAEDLFGIRGRRGNYSNRLKLDSAGALDRLNGRNSLGADVADSISRNNFSSDAAEKLSQEFMIRHGELIQRTLKEFKPYSWHGTSTLSIQRDLEANKPRIKSILFDGQGIYNVFQQHRDNLKKKFKDGAFSESAAEIKSLIDRLDGENESINKTIYELQKQRSLELLRHISDRSRLFPQTGPTPEKIEFFINRLYSNVLTTVAFQTSLVATFIGLFEQVYGLNFWATKTAMVNDEFTKYLASVESLFCPSTVSEFKRLVDVFEGKLEEGGSSAVELKIIPTNHTFRAVVFSEEMKPDQWPKYRYLILELWKPIDGGLKSTRDTEVGKCRRQVMQTHTQNCRDIYLRNHQKLEEHLTPREHARIHKDAMGLFRALLKNLGSEAQNFDDTYFNNLLVPTVADIDRSVDSETEEGLS